MPVKIRLDEAYEKIIEGIMDALQAANVEGGLLEEANSIVRGDRARPRPDTPAIWVFAETANPETTPRTIAETWVLPVSLTAIWKSDDPLTGQQQSTKLAALARSVVIKDRTLGGLAFVQDTKSGRFEPSGPHHNEGQLYGSAAQIRITFVICE